jgi:hypothetical protein
LVEAPTSGEAADDWEDCDLDDDENAVVEVASESEEEEKSSFEVIEKSKESSFGIIGDSHSSIAAPETNSEVSSNVPGFVAN